MVMSIWKIWEDASVSDVHREGHNYLISLLYDYESYIKYHEFVSVEYFLHHWTCIPLDGFHTLVTGDIVYDYSGRELEILEDSNYLRSRITAKYNHAFKKNVEEFDAGDLYYAKNTHFIQEEEHKKEEKICPILITKTSQAQS